jgi:hypothetical protein
MRPRQALFPGACCANNTKYNAAPLVLANSSHPIASKFGQIPPPAASKLYEAFPILAFDDSGRPERGYAGGALPCG